MPIHWVHQALPGFLQRQKNQLLDVMAISALLEKYGWQLNLKRARRTIYQAITPKAAIVERIGYEAFGQPIFEGDSNKSALNNPYL